jgi:uncharacterized protein
MIKINIRQLTNEGMDFSGKISREDLGLVISNSANHVTFDDFADYQFHISSVSDGVLVDGTVKVGVNADCGRCLGDYHFILQATDVCHFYEHVKGDELDITDDIREDVLISLPTKYLCSQDCVGLCPTCGKNLNREKCECMIETVPDDEEANPWNELDKLDL